MLKFITSFNEELHGQYGERFLNTWKKHSSPDIHLTVYCEGGTSWLGKDFLSENITAASLESDELTSFRSIFGKFIQAQGGVIQLANEKENLYRFNYNYRFDALRFCFKAFSFHQELKSSDLARHSHLCWIDADVVCKEYFSPQTLTPVLPIGSHLASYLGRTSFPPTRPHSECGFFGINLHHPEAITFIESYIGMYTSGSLFLRPEWHDCEAFDHVRKNFEALNFNFLNISGKFQDEEHPFIRSKLGEFFDHLKGPARKSRGHS